MANTDESELLSEKKVLINSLITSMFFLMVYFLLRDSQESLSINKYLINSFDVAFICLAVSVVMMVKSVASFGLFLHLKFLLPN